jgi:hypothetical protein
MPLAGAVDDGEARVGNSDRVVAVGRPEWVSRRCPGRRVDQRRGCCYEDQIQGHEQEHEQLRTAGGLLVLMGELPIP